MGGASNTVLNNSAPVTRRETAGSAPLNSTNYKLFAEQNCSWPHPSRVGEKKKKVEGAATARRHGGALSASTNEDSHDPLRNPIKSLGVPLKKKLVRTGGGSSCARVSGIN
jgi:hypothetical protein